MTSSVISLVFQAVRFESLKVKESTTTPYYGENSFPHEKELVKAQLVVELMDRYQYPPQAIHVNYLVPLENHYGYEEADVFVVNKNKKPFAVFLVESPDMYEENREAALDQLYRVAPVLNKEKTLVCLCYYTRWYEGGNLERKQVVVEYQKYPTKKLWESAGSPENSPIPLYST
jgi:hypothetical protein